MGNRYEIATLCKYCGKENEEIWYAPTSGADTFKCQHCNKTNFITLEHQAMKLEEVTEEDILEGLMFTSTMCDEDALRKEAKQKMQEIEETIEEEEEEQNG